jgi:hypothetical protein
MDNAKFQAKTKVLAKLFNEGFNTEKEILNLDLNRLLSINSITIADLRLIAKLQKYLKNNKLISYLSGADEEQKE